MILDVIENFSNYSGLNEGIDRVVELLGKYNSENFSSNTRLFVDGESIYMNFDEYETHSLEDSRSEAHRKYIDVMHVIEGAETVYVKPSARLRELTDEYDEGRDVLFAKTDDDVIPIRLDAGKVLILFPSDAHAPACDLENGKHLRVKKIIGKVLIK